MALIYCIQRPNQAIRYSPTKPPAFLYTCQFKSIDIPSTSPNKKSVIIDFDYRTGLGWTLKGLLVF